MIRLSSNWTFNLSQVNDVRYHRANCLDFFFEC